MRSSDLKNIINVFIISGFISLITITYVGFAYTKHQCSQRIPYKLFPIFIPILYGIFGIINYYIIMNYGIKFSFIIGMLLGLTLSIIGRFGLNLPLLIFDFTKQTENNVHIIAMVLYAVIFQFIITPLTTYIV
jgi:hypothetical protein